MTRIGNMAVLAMTIICGLSTGCQNTIHVRVQKVVGVRYDPGDRRVDTSKDLLASIAERSRDALKHLNQIVPFPSGLEEYKEALEETIKRAEFFEAECEACLKAPKPEHSHVDPVVTLNSVREFAKERHSVLSKWSDRIKDIAAAAPGSEQARIKDLQIPLFSINQQISFAERQSQQGFGGFYSSDIYPINPSDEKWGDILKHRSPIVHAIHAPFWQDTSLETITSAKVSVSGDSAIMLVMEHPGQVRVYQVSMDPTQITRNVGLLISKATAATAKYMSGGLAP